MSHHRIITRTLLAALGLASIGSASLSSNAKAQTFIPTSGAQVWNDDANWGQPFPNDVGATATIPAPTDILNIELGQTIKLGTLTINKSTTASFDTTITATAPNGFVFEGGGTIRTNASFANGGGSSIVAAPVSFDGLLTITQGDDQVLRLNGPLSGAGSVNINRDNNGEQHVTFNAANSYAGSTTVTGSAGTLFAVLRLNNATAVPGGVGVTGGLSNIKLTNSAILGLGSTDFTRGLGTGPDQIQFSAAINSGFAAFGATRAVNLGGASAPVDWAAAGFATSLTLGSPTSDATLDFQNPINFGSTGRNIRAVDGTAAVDGRISASITSSGTANFTKSGGGTLSLAAANSYTGNTIISAGALRVDHLQALPANTNMALSGGGLLGLGVADYAATIGIGAGQIQFGTGNAGFAAYAGDRKVTLNGGAPLVWGPGGFNVAGNLILNDEGADSLLEFTNAIDLNGATRIIVARDGTARIDSKLSGGVTGTGGLTKTQPGTLELPVANTYTGTTTASGGVLLLTNANSIPGGINGASTGNITLVGGVLGLGAGDFTAPLGFGAGQIQWTAAENGGFAAFGGNRLVNIGGASAPLTWGVDGFTTANLILSWASSDSLVEFVNPIDLNGAARTFAGRDGTVAIDSRVSGVISGVGLGSVIKTQPGTLEFTAANTYEGGTAINAGRLLANNTTGSAFGTGDVTVAAAGTLGGNGFIGTAGDASNVSVSGHLAPGASAGKLSVVGDVTFQAGSFFDLELGGATPATQFDQLAIDGTATLAGSITVSLLNGYIPASGSSFEVLSATGGVTGTFALAPSNGIAWEATYGANALTLVSRFAADFNNDGLVNGSDLDVWRFNSGLATGATRATGDADADGDVDGADFLTWQRYVGIAGTPATATITSVPEPSSLTLFCVAALGNLMLRMRRRVRKSRRVVN